MYFGRKKENINVWLWKYQVTVGSILCITFILSDNFEVFEDANYTKTSVTVILNCNYIRLRT